MEGLYPEEVSNMARGHKANLSNPNTSEESKEHSKEVLKKLGGEDAFYSKDDDDQPQGGNDQGGHKNQTDEKDPKRVAAGLKSAINNPEDSHRHVSEQARKEAQEKLDKLQS